MKKVTVNVVVEISEGEDVNTYKASNGGQFTVLTERDLVNLINFSGKQIISSAIPHSLIAFQKTELVAQDGFVLEEE